jgi:SAM-dependent methyltransferase
MLESEFDRFADEYEQILARDIRISGETPEFFAAYKAADVQLHLAGAGTDIKQRLRILDFGCGVGGSLPYLRENFPAAELIGADISRKSLEVAQRRYPNVARFLHFYDDQPLPLEDRCIDVSFSACVFHHIPHNDHNKILRDLLRVIRPGGWLFIFEHNPLNPLTARIVKACPFDDNAVLIRAGELKRRIQHAGFVDAEVRYRIFIPGALRQLRPLEAALTWCPFGAQYYVAARRSS